MMSKTVRKHGVALALLATGSTGLTVAINELTKSTIDQQAALQQKALFDQVLPAGRCNNDLLESCYLVSTPALGKGQHEVWMTRNSNQPVGAVMEATAPDDYSEAIQLLAAADSSGAVPGTRVTGHHETPGLDDKIGLRLSDWVAHFTGKVTHGQGDSHWAVKKDGGNFDQFTGAAITPRAMINAVKRASLYTQTLLVQLPEFTTCGE